MAKINKHVGSSFDDFLKEEGIYEEVLEQVAADEAAEALEKSCPRCGGKSANSSNPQGRCSACLKKLKSAKKTPGHWQRAQTKADDALRRQKGKNGTAHKKTSGLGTRASIVAQTKRAEKKTGQKLSPDRKNNGKGYAAGNTRMVPEKLNRGRHHVDGKKLRAWQKRLKKTATSDDEFYTYLLAKAHENNDTALLSLLDEMHPNDLANFINNEDDSTDLEKGWKQNIAGVGLAAATMLNPTPAKADYNHVHGFLNSMKDIPGMQVKTNLSPGASHGNISVGRFNVKVKAMFGGASPLSNHEVHLHGPKEEHWTEQDHKDYVDAKHIHGVLGSIMPKLMDMQQPTKKVKNSK